MIKGGPAALQRDREVKAMTAKEAAIKIMTVKAWQKEAEKMMGVTLDKMSDVQFGVAAATMAAMYELKGAVLMRPSRPKR